MLKDWKYNGSLFSTENIGTILLTNYYSYNKYETLHLGFLWWDLFQLAFGNFNMALRDVPISWLREADTFKDKIKL